MSLSTETQNQPTGSASFGGLQARSEAALNDARVAIRNLDFSIPSWQLRSSCA